MKIIFLTGPKHCGKTATGRELATLLSCGFTDLDDLIFWETGRTPRQLYEQSPEIFKKAEAEALANFLKNECGKTEEEAAKKNNSGGENKITQIMATGGGIIDNSRTVPLLKNTETVIIYLNVSAETAWNRIAGEGELPPFLKTENPKESHRLLHERRGSAYQEIADIVINSEGKTPRVIAQEIYSRL